MSDILVRIKRAVLAGRYVFSEKARLEMERIRSQSPFRQQRREYLYVIQGTNLDGNERNCTDYHLSVVWK
jgi:hypothetical protein